MDTNFDSEGVAGEVDVITCAICMESNGELCVLPCCHKDQSSVQFCASCITLLCARSSIATFSCPGCRSFVSLEFGELIINEKVGHCSVCHLINHMATPELCHGCLKRRMTLSHLLYECEQCHGLQHIPHPVWRYQPSPSSFTVSALWTCHQGCDTRTNWRLLEEDLPRIPQAERPASWSTAASRFYEIVEELDEAKKRSIERRTSFWKCVYYAVCVMGAVKVLDLGASLVAFPDQRQA